MSIDKSSNTTLIFTSTNPTPVTRRYSRDQLVALNHPKHALPQGAQLPQIPENTPPKLK